MKVINMKKIKLTQNKFAVVDDKYFEWLNEFCWCADKNKRTYYACFDNRYMNGKYIYMHRLIMELILKRNLLKKEQIDHKNGNGLDNRECNLRVCDSQQQSMNRNKKQGTSSKYKGVDWVKSHKKWRSRIKLNGKEINLGCFDDEIKAAKEYDKAASKLFGEFARLNFKDD